MGQVYVVTKDDIKQPGSQVEDYSVSRHCEGMKFGRFKTRPTFIRAVRVTDDLIRGMLDDPSQIPDDVKIVATSAGLGIRVQDYQESRFYSDGCWLVLADGHSLLLEDEEFNSRFMPAEVPA